MSHDPQRPRWQCTQDGQPWPCPAARVQLRERHAISPIRLAVHMGEVLGMAAADLGTSVPAAELWSRFVEWTRY